MDNMKSHFSPHLRGLAHQTAKKSPAKPNESYEKDKATMEHGQPEEKHTSETHGTQPHPTTGVHAVHIHRMGGGKAMTHTHHEGGHIESQEHPTMGDAHAHAQQSLPAEDNGQEKNEDAMVDNDSTGTDMDDSMPSSIGQMA